MKLLEKKFSLLAIIPNLYYVLFFVTPLLMSSKTSEIFEFNKMIFIYLITIAITTLYLLDCVIRRKKIIFTALYIPLLIFLLSQLLSTLFSIDVHTSIFGYYGRWNGGLVSIIAYITLFFVAVQTLNFFHVKRLLMVSLIASALVILWGLPGKFGFDLSCYVFSDQLTNTCWTNDFNPAERMFSTLGQPNWLGAYLAIHFFIGCYFIFTKIQITQNNWQAFVKEFFQKNTWMYTTYLLLNLIVIWFTKSRSSQLAVLVGIVIGSLFVINTLHAVNRKTKKIIWTALAIFFVGTVFVSIQGGIISNIFSLPSESTAITDSFDIRKVVWKGAIDLGNTYPLFGSGVETFAYAYYFTRPQAHNLTSEWDFIYNKAHNEYLHYFGTTGYFGLISYLLVIVAFFGVSIWYFVKTNDPNRKLLLGCLMLSYITILITNFFGFSVSSIQLFYYVIPALVVVISRKDLTANFYSYELKLLNTSARIIVGTIILAGAAGIYSIYNYYTADMLYAKARVNMDNDEYSAAYGELTSALRKKYEHVYEDKLSNTAANLAFLDSFSDEKSLVSELITISKDTNSHTLQMSPKNILYLRTRGKNYYLYYQTTHKESDLLKAIFAMEEVVKIANTDVQSKYTLALFYYIASQEITDKAKSVQYMEKTTSTLEEVLRMKPNYIEAQELYKEIVINE